MNPSGKVQFVYVVGDVLPTEVDDSTIYVVGTTKKAIYVGSNFIVSDLTSDFEALRTYIENYLGSEDFIDDIKTALHQMVDAGAFDELISPMVQQALPGVVADQIDDSVASQISAPVSDWLTAHVDPSSQYVIDDTMSIHGAAADAKAAGDAIADIVKVSETAPSSDFNRIWVVDGPVSEVEVPTMDEFTSLKSALNLLDSVSLTTLLDQSFSQSVDITDSYKISNQMVFTEGEQYLIEVEISNIAGGSWVSESYPIALRVYLSSGNVGPNSQYVKRILISQNTLTTKTYKFSFVATPTDAEADHICVYVQLNPSGNFAGKIVVNSVYNIPNKIAEIEPLLYVNKPDSHGKWTQGTINSSDGNINVRSDRIADITYYDSDTIDNVYVDDDYDLLYGLYTSDSINGFVSTSSWVKSVNAPFTQKYVRFCIRKSAGGDILPSEETGFTIVYKKKTIQSAIEDFDDFTVPYTIGSTNQVARLGWMVYASDTPPEQSIASYTLAYKNHARIMLCDVRVTADGRYICWHDADLGAELGTNTVRHADGTELTIEEKEQLISSLTLEQLNSYDYGLYKGAEYAGTKMLTLFDFVKWCALANCIPMIEIKVQLTSSQVSEIATVIKAVGLSDRVIIDDYQSHFANNLSDWLSELPNATICIIAGAAGYNTAITMCRTAIESGNKALITLSTTSQLSQIQDQSGNLDMSKVALATDYGIGLSYTELTNDSALLEFYNGGYMDVFSYIACRTRLDNWIASKIGI